MKTGFSGDHLRRSLNRGPQYRVIEQTTAPEFTVDGDGRAGAVRRHHQAVARRAHGCARTSTRRSCSPPTDESATSEPTSGRSLKRYGDRIRHGQPRRERQQVERLNAAIGAAIKWMSRAQTWVFKKTGGKFGDKFLRGTAVGILTTIGRKTGRAPESPLLYPARGPADRSWSRRRADASKQPQWYLNLKANPAGARSRSSRDVLHLTARDATDAERDRVLAEARRDVLRLRELPVVHRPGDPDRHLRSVVTRRPSLLLRPRLPVRMDDEQVGAHGRRPTRLRRGLAVHLAANPQRAHRLRLALPARVRSRPHRRSAPPAGGVAGQRPNTAGPPSDRCTRRSAPASSTPRATSTRCRRPTRAPARARAPVGDPSACRSNWPTHWTIRRWTTRSAPRPTRRSR